MNRRLLLLCMMAILAIHARSTIVDGVRQKPQPVTIEFDTDVEAYLYNVSAQAFFTEGNAWGTQASVGGLGLLVKFTAADEAYLFNDYSIVKNGWNIVFFDSETAMFVDRYLQSDYYWEIEENADGTFRLLPASKNPTINKDTYPDLFVGLDVTENSANTALSPLLTSGNGHYIDWALVTPNSYEEYNKALKVYNKAQKLKSLIDQVTTLGGDVTGEEAVYLNEDATMDELETAIGSANKAHAQALIDNAADKNNVDVTILLLNPDFEQDEDGWTVEAADGTGYNGHQGNVRPGGSDANHCYEAWNNPEFDIYQEVQGAPVGVYEIQVQGFYRYGRGDDAWNAYLNQNVDYVKPKGVPVYVYMNNNATNFVNVYGDPQQISDESFYSSGSTDYAWQSKNGINYYFPNGMASAAIAFSAGMYKQSAYGLVAREGDVMRLGVKGNSNQLNDSWVIWDDFKLNYRGFQSDVIKPVLESAMEDVQIYIGLLMGKTEYAALTTALGNAETAIENNDGEDMFNALNDLYAAKDPARISKDLFLEKEISADVQRLEEAINSVSNQKLSLQTLTLANDLLAAIKGNTKYENYETDILKDDVSAMIYTLDNSVSLYGQLLEAINDLQSTIDNYDDQSEVPSGVCTKLVTTIAQYTEGSIADGDISDAISEIHETIEQLNSFITTTEWEILRDGYEAMGNGEGWDKQWDFESENHTIYQVPGVTAENGHIVSIDLHSNNLTGNFPFALLNLPHLQTLYVDYNQLEGDMGKELQEFVALHPEAGQSLQQLYMSYNKLGGNIGQVASLLPALTKLNASGNRFSEVYPTISRSIDVELRYQELNSEIVINLKDMSAASLADQLPPIVLYNHSSQTFGPNVRLHVYNSAYDYYFHMYMHLKNLECIDESNGTVSFNGGNVFIEGTGAYCGQSGDLLSIDNDGRYDTPWGCQLTTRFFFDQGDSNFDGEVNILDLQNDINYILEVSQNLPFNFTAANLWEDDVINVQDVVKTVDLLLAQDTSSDTNGSRSLSRHMAQAYGQQPEAALYCQDGQLVLNTSKPVAAFDITVSGASTLTVSKSLERMGFVCTMQRQGQAVRLIGYSLSGAILPVGETVIASTRQPSAEVSSAMLSSEAATVIPVQLNTMVTGITQPNMNGADSRDVYHLPLGRGRSIVIDGAGTKTIEKK